MSEALDTSVVLRLLTGEPAVQAEVARRYLQDAASPVFVDAVVVGESYFALRHHYHVPHHVAIDALLAVVTSDRIAALPEVCDALTAAQEQQKPGVMDRLILAVARASDRILVTFDRELARLEGSRELR